MISRCRALTGWRCAARHPGPELVEIVKLLGERCKTLKEMAESCRYFYEEFDAFDVDALNYLVKPVDDEKLEAVLRKAEERIQELQADNAGRASITVTNGKVHTRVYLDDIVYAEVFNRKIVIHTTTDDIEYYGKMSELQDMAGESFFRPHRAYLINMKYVERYDSSHIYLEKGQVTMAKQNYKCFVESYMKYSMRGIGE